MGMNKNTVLGWATFIMVLMGLLLIGLGAFRYRDVSGWGFGAVGQRREDLQGADQRPDLQRNPRDCSSAVP